MKKINNHSRFLNKKDSWGKGHRHKSVGYCMLHNMYVTDTTFKKKNCRWCERFIKLNNLEDNNEG